MMVTNELKTFKEIVSHPTTANVFIYLKNNIEPVGVREVQRSLNISSSSTAHWHLNKLLEHHIIEQLSDNRYQITDQYKDVNRIPIAVTLDHYIVGKKMIPELVILITFLFTITIGVLFFIITVNWVQAAIIGLLGLIVAIFLLFRFYKRFSLQLV